MAKKQTREHPQIFLDIADLADLAEQTLADGLESSTGEHFEHLERAAERTTNIVEARAGFEKKYGAETSDDARSLTCDAADGAFRLGIAVGLRLSGAR